MRIYVTKRPITPGEKFGRLTAIRPDEKRRWVFKCDCGTEKRINRFNVLRGTTRSCGCLLHESQVQHGRTNTLKHGMWQTKAFYRWSSMLARCCNPTHRAYNNYGGRGITVCERWRESFAHFYADMGDAPTGLTLDRVDNDKGYSPENCRWSDWRTQLRNRRVPRRKRKLNMQLTMYEITVRLMLTGASCKLIGQGTTVEEAFIDGIRNVQDAFRPSTSGKTRQEYGLSVTTRDGRHLNQTLREFEAGVNHGGRIAPEPEPEDLGGVFG